MALPSGISFSTDLRVKLPDRFNVAAPFIDRHLGEGRGAKAAIRTAHETVTYAELAERVNRAGNALLTLGLKPGDRLLMVVKDCPAFFYLFWGAIKAGIVAVPPNTARAGQPTCSRFGLRTRRHSRSSRAKSNRH
jgi:acyl-coenzyme A synthetase/AMP-(fatty) acid ligase